MPLTLSTVRFLLFFDLLVICMLSNRVRQTWKELNLFYSRFFLFNPSEVCILIKLVWICILNFLFFSHFFNSFSLSILFCFFGDWNTKNYFIETKQDLRERSSMALNDRLNCCFDRFVCFALSFRRLSQPQKKSNKWQDKMLVFACVEMKQKTIFFSAVQIRLCFDVERWELSYVSAMIASSWSRAKTEKKTQLGKQF